MPFTDGRRTCQTQLIVKHILKQAIEALERTHKIVIV